MKKICILGLGAGNVNQLTIGLYRLLTEANPVYLRTKQHPVVKELEQEGFTYPSFDYIYEQHTQFEQVYADIVAYLEQQVEIFGQIYYAVPGHPSVAERTVQMLLQHSKVNGYEVEIMGGQSFLDPLFARLQVDPVEGFLLLDGTCLEAHTLHPQVQTVITQVYDEMIASEVKLTLMEVFPDDYLIIVATAIGISGLESIKEIPLFELDRVTSLSNLTCVYVPATEEESILNRQYYHSRSIFRVLRGPDGCPWDKKQTHQSLKKYLLEEVEEVLEAIDEGDYDHLTEELGDVLLQVFLHAQIAEEEGYFNMEDILQTLNEKMIRRHPHVFGDVQLDHPEEVIQQWNKIKKEEKESI